MPSHRPRLKVLSSVALATLLSLAVAGPAAAERRSISASAEEGRQVIFELPDLGPAQIRRAGVRLGSHRHRLSTRRVRNAARRGELRVRPSGPVWNRLRRPVSGSSGRASGIRRLRLTLAVTPAPTRSPGPELPPPGPVSGRLASFETGDWSEVSWSSHTSNAGIGISGARGYDGSNSVEISYDGEGGNVFSRVWYDIDWQRGSDVWYGAAFYVADPSKLRWTDLMRWDNYESFGGGSSGETGGLLVDDGKLLLKRSNYDGSNYASLTEPVPVPAGRWFWVEVHQRLSEVPGEALNELYIDNRMVGSSTVANSRGRQIDHLRYGYVYNLDKGGASNLYMDRLSISDGRRGPLS
jgi:hypothetical protein